MTYEEKANFLCLYRDNTTRLYGLAQEADRWRQIAMCTSSKGDGMPQGSHTGGKVANASINAADIVREIEQDIEAAHAERQQIREIIRTAPRRKRQLLELHYINGLHPAQIANQCGKSEEWIRKSLRNAVNALKM